MAAGCAAVPPPNVGRMRPMDTRKEQKEMRARHPRPRRWVRRSRPRQAPVATGTRARVRRLMPRQ
eukprot:9654464-Alexandrium_andersonii.AAC.1